MLHTKVVKLPSGLTVELKEWSFRVLGSQSAYMQDFLLYVRALLKNDLSDPEDPRIKNAMRIIDYSVVDTKIIDEIPFRDVGDLLIEIYELNQVGEVVKKLMALDLLHQMNVQEALERQVESATP